MHTTHSSEFRPLFRGGKRETSKKRTALVLPASLVHVSILMHANTSTSDAFIIEEAVLVNGRQRRSVRLGGEFNRESQQPIIVYYSPLPAEKSSALSHCLCRRY